MVSGLGGERFQWNLLTVQFPGYTFYHLFSKYDNPIYLYSAHLFENGGHRKGMAYEVRGSKHTDTI